MKLSTRKAYRLVVERTDERIAFAIFSCGYRSFGLDDRVDTTDSMSYFSSNLKEQVVLDVASLLASGTHLDGNVARR
jgi:hypothetical protein